MKLTFLMMLMTAIAALADIGGFRRLWPETRHRLL